MEAEVGKHTCVSSSVRSSVDLGFVEEVDCSESLLSYRFPSKVGGRPAWLGLKDLPGVAELSCPSCKKTRVLLLQIYSPDDKFGECFHRTLFVFVCREPECCRPNSNKNFLVLRCQLPRANEFYSDKAPVLLSPSGKWVETTAEDFPKQSATDFRAICFVCGGLGPKTCSKCQKVSYCSRHHQKVHWTNGHKKKCNDGLERVEPREFPAVVFRESKLEIESEQLDSESESEADPDDEEVSGAGGVELAESELEKLAYAGTKEDQVFIEFRKRVEKDPEQVLRYERGGEPLWVSGQHVPGAADIPDCSCGKKRRFEFQVLPQLLNHLGVDSLGNSLDWGTLAVYTCPDNCQPPGGYRHEFLWKQDFTATSDG